MGVRTRVRPTVDADSQLWGFGWIVDTLYTMSFVDFPGRRVDSDDCSDPAVIGNLVWRGRLRNVWWQHVDGAPLEPDTPGGFPLRSRPQVILLAIPTPK